jgi:hypothetical protein
MACLAIVLAALALHGPAIMRGRVLLPADVILLMRPWGPVAVERFPDIRHAQNQLLGPMFEYYPWRHYARARLRSGEVPLWNPYEMGGNALLGNSQSAVLYPPNAALYLLPLWVGINLVTLFHTTVTGLLMLGFLRGAGLRPCAAVCGAMTWMLCGSMIVWMEFQTPTAVLCWLPGCLWASDALVRNIRRRRSEGLRGIGASGSAMLALLSVALALALTAGHPQFAYYVLVACAVYMLVRSPRIMLWAGPTVLVASVCLGSATLLPVAESARINHRVRDASYTEAIALRLPPSYLGSLLVPNVRGNPRDYVQIREGVAAVGHPYVGTYDFTEYCQYVGIPALLLAVFGVIRSWRRRTALSMAILGVLGLALALGTPIGAVFHYLAPGWSQFYAPARAVCLVQFALAALAGFGLDAALAESESGGAASAARLGAGLAAAVGLAAVAVWPLSAISQRILTSPEWIAYAALGIRHAVLFSAGAGLALWMLLRVPGTARDREPGSDRRGAKGRGRHGGISEQAERWRRPASVALPLLCALDLLLWGRAYSPAVAPAILTAPPQRASIPNPEPWARALSFEEPRLGIKSMIVPNFNVTVGYREAQGANPVHSRRYHEAMRAAAEAMTSRRPVFGDHNTVRMPTGHHPLFDVLNVTHATTLGADDPPGPHYTRETQGLLTVWRNTGALGPARLVFETVQASDVAEAVAILGRSDHDARRVAVVEAALPDIHAPQEGAGAIARVSLAAFSAHRVAYAVDTPSSGLLVASEVAYPGWTAQVARSGEAGARRVAIAVADAVLRAVTVPPGRSTVTFRYEPGSFRLGLFVTLVSCGTLAALAGARVMLLRRASR